MEMGGGIRRFRNHSVAGTVRWPITLIKKYGIMSEDIYNIDETGF